MAERATWTEAQRATFAEPHRRPNEDWIRREVQAAYDRGRRDGWRNCFITALTGLISGTLLAAMLMSI